jgi:hypothetical protein
MELNVSLVASFDNRAGKEYGRKEGKLVVRKLI